jgi:hypothetical protein
MQRAMIEDEFEQDDEQDDEDEAANHATFVIQAWTLFRHSDLLIRHSDPRQCASSLPATCTSSGSR